MSVFFLNNDGTCNAQTIVWSDLIELNVEIIILELEHS